MIDDTTTPDGGIAVAGWVRLAGESSASLATRAELVARWAEPHRRYHTLTHLAAVLAAIDRLAAEAADESAVRLAAWFHDAIYDGRPGWDEERSAQLAQSRLPRCDVPPARIAEVARLVRLTAAHDTLRPGDRNGAVLCDADLAILGSPEGSPASSSPASSSPASGPESRPEGSPEGSPRSGPEGGPTYSDYVAAIRQEYAHVPGPLFAQGRAQVLRRLLATPALFHTALARDLWEDRARANMTAELSTLTPPD